jgi:hypothetical protein
MTRAAAKNLRDSSRHGNLLIVRYMASLKPGTAVATLNGYLPISLRYSLKEHMQSGKEPGARHQDCADGDARRNNIAYYRRSAVDILGLCFAAGFSYPYAWPAGERVRASS